MNVINLLGGPGVGKSTTAAYLYYRFKKAGFRTELVGEAAREIIYGSSPRVTAPQLMDNQLLVSGMQYERLLRLKRHNVEIAISDSPLVQGALYVPEEQKNDMLAMLERLSKNFDNTYVFIQRELGTYDRESRAQTEAQAIILDAKARELGNPSMLTMNWGGERELANTLLEWQQLSREQQRMALLSRKTTWLR